MKYTPIIIGIAGTKGSGKDTIASIINYCMRVGFAKADYYDWRKQYDFNKIDPNYPHIVHFADALKDICSLIFNIPRIYFDNTDYKDNWVYYFTERSFIKIDNLDTEKFGIITIEDLKNNDYNLMSARFHYNMNGKLACISTRTIMQYIGTELFRNKVSKNTWIDICINKAKNCSDNGWCIIPDVRFKNEAESIKEIYDRKTIIIKVERNTKHNDNHKSENIDFDSDYTIENNDSLMSLFYKVLNILNKETNSNTYADKYGNKYINNL